MTVWTFASFFSLSFGNIFETGTLLDPEYVLPAGQNEAAPIPFVVCEESSVTIVLGWDKMTAPVTFWVETPTGNKIPATEQHAESARGRKWRFIKLALPYNGEQNGTWKVHVVRENIMEGEFPVAGPSVAVRFFLNVTVKDGPAMRLMNRKVKYYTGDTINPLVAITRTDGFVPANTTIKLIVKKPADSTGNILSKKGLRTVSDTDGDAVSPVFATLQFLEKEQGKPVISYADESFELFDGRRAR